MFMVLGATLSHDWSTFTAFRSLQGLFGTVPQVIGLPIIHDMYSSEGRCSQTLEWEIDSNKSRMAADDQYLVSTQEENRGRADRLTKRQGNNFSCRSLPRPCDRRIYRCWIGLAHFLRCLDSHLWRINSHGDSLRL